MATLVMLASVLYAFNRERVTRLLATTSLFNENKIVGNFSSMERTLLTVPIANTGEGIHREGEFPARGISGQFIYLDRDNRTVIVKTAANRKFRETGVMDPNLAFFRAVADVR